MLLKIVAGAVLVAALIGLAVGGWLVLHAWGQARRYAHLKDTHDLALRVDHLGHKYTAKRGEVCLTIGVYQRGERYTSPRWTPAAAATDAAAHALYEIGSITKVFTGILLARMIEEGTVRPDETLAECLSERLSLSDEVSRITLAQLAAHTAGLPRLPANFDQVSTDPTNPYAQYLSQHLYQELPQVALVAPPGRRTAYSNMGYGLLGHLLARRAQLSYETLLRQEITAPLCLEDTVITLSDAQRQRMLPGRLPSGERVPEWDFDVLAPAGALRSTVSDLLSFIHANLHPPEGILGRAIGRAQQAQFGDWSGSRVGLGWQIREDVYTDLVILWHNGGTGGFCSFLGIIPAHDVGVVLLSNSGDAWSGDRSLDDMGLEILTLASKVSLRAGAV
jgi:CubicO group peptidase (beta-lactamase class C family)